MGFFRWVFLGGFFGWVFYCQPCLELLQGLEARSHILLVHFAEDQTEVSGHGCVVAPLSGSLEAPGLRIPAFISSGSGSSILG